jgi:hypothetical protein
LDPHATVAVRREGARRPPRTCSHALNHIAFGVIRDPQIGVGVGGRIRPGHLSDEHSVELHLNPNSIECHRVSPPAGTAAATSCTRMHTASRDLCWRLPTAQNQTQVIESAGKRVVVAVVPDGDGIATSQQRQRPDHQELTR